MKVTGMTLVRARWLLLAALCATAPLTLADDASPDVGAAMRRSFEAKHQAGMERLNQDDVQALCTRYTPASLPPAAAALIQQASLASVKPPAAGQYLGDYRRGEQIAQTGTGLQSSDDPAKPNGGNCYACHQLAASELAYGTIGPSLQRYGKLRGQSPAMLEAAWRKLYNPQADVPCSNMPRFGHQKILNEQQLKDLMAFLFDPASPVNQ
jgi:sulfur-oxidizing protein SoxX